MRLNDRRLPGIIRGAPLRLRRRIVYQLAMDGAPSPLVRSAMLPLVETTDPALVEDACDCISLVARRVRGIRLKPLLPRAAHPAVADALRMGAQLGPPPYWRDID
jgi:hypothetical protein